MDQSLTVPLQAPVASWLPSGEKAQPTMGRSSPNSLAWLASVRSWRSAAATSPASSSSGDSRRRRAAARRAAARRSENCATSRRAASSAWLPSV